jgi:hypothetical protein
MYNISYIITVFMILAIIIFKIIEYYGVKNLTNEFKNKKISDLTFIPKDAVVDINEPNDRKKNIEKFLSLHLLDKLTSKHRTRTLVCEKEPDDFKNYSLVLCREQINNCHLNFKTKSQNYYIYENLKPVPKILWSFWDSAKLPKIVKLCKKSWEMNLSDYQIRLLNKHNLSKYCGKKFIRKIINLSPALQSDFIRLQLLYLYGGVWVDATTFVNEPLDYFIKSMGSKDLFFLIKSKLILKCHCWESFFLIATPHSSTVLSILTNLNNIVFLNKKYARLTLLQMYEYGLNNKYHIVYLSHLNECYNNANVLFNTENNKILTNTIFLDTKNIHFDISNLVIKAHCDRYDKKQVRMKDRVINDKIINLFPLCKLICIDRKYFRITNGLYGKISYNDILKLKKSKWFFKK